MRNMVNINRKWAFRKGVSAPPKEMPNDWDFVNLPHTWNAIDGQDGGNDYYRGTCMYVKQLDREELPAGERQYLEFLGANSSADVYLNGVYLAHHDGGYSTFRVDITDELKNGTLLAVAVDNGENDRVYPQMADFTFYGGLYRNVNVIGVPTSHFDLEYYGAPGLAVTPTVQGEGATVEIEAFLQNAEPTQTVRFTVTAADGSTVAVATSAATDAVKASVEIPNVRLWNGRKDPYLYTAKVELTQNGEVLDTVSARFGCRSFEITADKGFILNGESYPLHGVARHQDVWGLGNALLPEHHKTDMDLICEVGANTIRLAHYQHDGYFYDLCDETGMVVWAEIPYISKHMKNGRDNTVSQMKELILQNYNHPSIVLWGLSNEISMHGTDEDLLENHRLLNDLVHSMDKTRPTSVAVVSMCDVHDPYLQIPDVLSFNHYFGWYGGDTSMNGPWFDKFHEEFPQIPVGMSEYGCEGLNWHTSNPVQGDYTEEYQAHYHEELIKQLFTRPYLWATHVWNMFDFGADARGEGGENGQNHKGLVTFDRKYKKDAFYAYKAWLSDTPFVHICGKRYIDRVEEVTKVTVYSNLPEVELFANEKSLGKQKSDVHFFYFDVPNAGETRLKATAGDCTDESILRKVEVFNESYRLKEKGAVLNWFDITAPEGYFSLNDKLSDILESAAGKALFERLRQQMQGTFSDKAGGFTMNESMLQMMGGFTVLRLTNLLSTIGVSLSKEELLSLNTALNQIRKP